MKDVKTFLTAKTRRHEKINKKWTLRFILFVLFFNLSTLIQAKDGHSPYAAWKHGPPAGVDYFPIAVWLQDPRNAAKYKEAGFNLYIGLWKGPSEEQLSALVQTGMQVICEQNEVALKHLNDPTIVGWMHEDEPDNAQALPEGQDGYGPPIPPSQIVKDYQKFRRADPSRPVILNLGQGVAWDGWYGRGVRSGHPEDYAEYLKGCDIGSFDIYPVVHESPEVKGKLEFVPKGVSRLRQWSKPGGIVWNAIECTHIENANIKPTPQQVKAEVWMSLIHGSQGIIYFAHQFKPSFIEAALLADPEMLKVVTDINHQIKQLAPVLNSPSFMGQVVVQTSNPDIPVDTMVKLRKNEFYLFAVGMGNEKTRAVFQWNNLPARTYVEVLGEGRGLWAKDGRLQDDFEPYGVHLYRIQLVKDMGHGSTKK